MLKLEKTKDGKIKDFTIEDAHTIYCMGVQTTTNKVLFKEALTIPSLDYLRNNSLNKYRDPADGMLVGVKWMLKPFIILELLTKGEAIHMFPSHPIMFKYWIRKTLHADNLKHRG